MNPNYKQCICNYSCKYAVLCTLEESIFGISRKTTNSFSFVILYKQFLTGHVQFIHLSKLETVYSIEIAPKIPNFCHIGLPPAKTYWMIMSPQKRLKKIPTICTCQTFIYYVNRLKMNFEVISKLTSGPKNSNYYHGPIDLQNPP